jgi:tRNA A37 threonylcarbamoyladenosine modification protein TsaB
VQFIINTSIDPHFCCVFHTDNTRAHYHQWTDRRADGREVWNFCAQNQIEPQKITFLGGVSGPGGFSCLRATAGILNALSFASGKPLYSIRAVQWIAAFLQHKNQPPDQFVLNSFGDAVFLPEAENKLRRVPVTEAAATQKPYYIGGLPPEKQKHFSHTLDLDFEGAEKILLTQLQSAPPQKNFSPDYEFPPV